MSRFKLSDFDLGSVGEFIRYLEVNLGLEAIDVNRVHSFRVTRTGLQGLLNRKLSSRALCQRNMSRISIDVANRKADNEISEEQLAVYRSLYCQWKWYDDALVDHINRLEQMIAHEMTLFPSDDLGDQDYDEPPF